MIMQEGDLVMIHGSTICENATNLRPKRLETGEVGIVIRDIGGSLIEVYINLTTFRVLKSRLTPLERKCDIIERRYKKEKKRKHRKRT